MKLLVPYPRYISLTILLQTLIYSVGLGQQVVCRYGRPTTDNNNNVVHCSCYLKYHGELCEKEPSCNLHCENAGKVRADCTCSCQQAFAGKYCEKNICPAVEQKSCSQLKKDSCGFSEVFPFCPYLCDTCKETQRPKCDEDALCHVSSYGCLFYGVRPTYDMCKTLGESGRDSANCDNNQTVADNCRKCDNNRLGFRHRCPVLCGICPDPDTKTTISSTESSVKSEISHDITKSGSERTSSILGSTEKKTNITLGHKQTESKTTVMYPAIIGALLAVVFTTSGAIIFFIIVRRRKKEDTRAVDTSESFATSQIGGSDTQEAAYQTTVVEQEKHYYEVIAVVENEYPQYHNYDDMTYVENLKPLTDSANYQQSIEAECISEHTYTSLQTDDKSCYQNITNNA